MERVSNPYLEGIIKTVQDFPVPGIKYYDITSILQVPEAFRYCIDRMAELYAGAGLDAVACIEARGFLFAAPLADRLGLPIVLIRKKGKLPGEVLERKFSLEYGTDSIQIHTHDIRPGDSVVVVDDLIATGGTVLASLELLKEAGAGRLEVFCVIGLPFLHFRERLKDYRVVTMVEFDHE